MSLYWIGAVLLIMLALSIVIIPWARYRKDMQRDALSNVQIIKQRMQELEREVSEGLISESERDVAVQELKVALVDETSSVVEQNDEQSKSVRFVLFGGMLFAIIAAAILYANSNEVQDLQHWLRVSADSKELARRIVVEGDPSITVTELQDFALAIRTQLATSPDNPVGWLLLGRLHQSTNRLDSALQAYEKALELDPNHMGVLNSYSQALLMTGEESYIEKARRVLAHALSLAPADVNLSAMSAMAATQLGDNPAAIRSWQQVKRNLPAEDPKIAEIDQRIAQLGGDDKPSTSVTITVSVKQELTEKLPKDAFLFVFAQDAQGDVRMPAAVVKSPLGDLPVKVTLSDANAMMPTYKLSQLTDVRLVARISLDENVAQAAGELQGEVLLTLEPGKQIEQQIVIDKELL